jgi:CTP:molybdopterin cytidylyltransferase MocA
VIVTFIPAAGRSSRMRGRDKLLETVGGVPILRRAAIEALKAGVGPVIVGIGPEDRERRKALRNLDVEILDVADAAEGMAATLRAGARAALAAMNATWGGDYEYFGMLVMLPDMPGIEASDIMEMDRVFQARGGPVVRATTEDGRAGHPVLFPDHAVRDFENLSGDKGAAAMMEGERIEFVALPGQRADQDLDTPEDWDAWRTETDHPR